MIEPKLTFFKVQVKGLRMHPTELNKPCFGIAPESFNPVDVGLVSGELVLPVIHPEMLSIPYINQAVIPSPAIGVDDAFKTDSAPNYLLQRRLRAIGDDLSIDTPLAFKDPKNDGLAVSAPASFSFNPPWAKERFIHFNLSAERRSSVTKFNQAKTNSLEITVDRVSAQPGQCGDLGGVEIDCKISK